MRCLKITADYKKLKTWRHLLCYQKRVAVDDDPMACIVEGVGSLAELAAGCSTWSLWMEMLHELAVSLEFTCELHTICSFVVVLHFFCAAFSLLCRNIRQRHYNEQRRKYIIENIWKVTVFRKSKKYLIKSFYKSHSQSYDREVNPPNFIHRTCVLFLASTFTVKYFLFIKSLK